MVRRRPTHVVVAARILLLSVVCTLALTAAFAAWDRGNQIWLGALPQENVLLYESVDFVEQDGAVIVMESSYKLARNVDAITWSDTLRCAPNNRITATQRTSQDRPSTVTLATPIEWEFTAPAITEWQEVRMCRMHSVITVEESGVTWRQRIASEPFELGESET